MSNRKILVLVSAFLFLLTMDTPVVFGQYFLDKSLEYEETPPLTNWDILGSIGYVFGVLIFWNIVFFGGKFLFDLYDKIKQH